MFSSAYMKLTDKETLSPIFIDHLRICCLQPEDDHTIVYMIFSQKFAVKESAPEILKACDYTHQHWLEENAGEL